MSIKGSDPAFPVECDVPEHLRGPDVRAFYPGVSVRTWLIGQALAGSAFDSDPILRSDIDDAANKVRRAALIADAALAEINKEST